MKKIKIKVRLSTEDGEKLNSFIIYDDCADNIYDCWQGIKEVLRNVMGYHIEEVKE